MICNRFFAIVLLGIFFIFFASFPPGKVPLVFWFRLYVFREISGLFLVDFGNAVLFRAIGGAIFLPGRGILLLLFGAACGKIHLQSGNLFNKLIGRPCIEWWVVKPGEGDEERVLRPP